MAIPNKLDREDKVSRWWKYTDQTREIFDPTSKIKDYRSHCKDNLTLGGGNWLQGLEETIYFLYLVLL